MCFTIEAHISRKAIEERFRVDTSALRDFDFAYFYRAFANPLLPVITSTEPQRVQLMNWGLIPSWVKDEAQAEKIRKSTYNARAETLDKKASFKAVLDSGRCLLIAGGFFEWQKRPGLKVPWYIRLKDTDILAFACLSDNWIEPGTGRSFRGFSLITTAANPLMEGIHNTQKRMPAILSPENEREWLREDLEEHRRKTLLLPLDDAFLEAHTVSREILDPRSNPLDPKLVEPFSYPEQGSLF